MGLSQPVRLSYPFSLLDIFNRSFLMYRRLCMWWSFRLSKRRRSVFETRRRGRDGVQTVWKENILVFAFGVDVVE